jgi:outer membrane receptor protein involved in Fe transport
VLVGEGRSHGIDFEANGKVLDNVSVLSSFTYLDARTTKDSALLALKARCQIALEAPSAPVLVQDNRPALE